MSMRMLSLSRLLFTLLLFTGSAEAQQPTKVPRIAYLGGASYAASSMRIEAFKQGLRELGYVEGKKIFSSSGATQRGKVIAYPR